MAKLLKKSEDSPTNPSEAREQVAAYHSQAPTETETHGMERAPAHPSSLSEDIRAHTNRPHKGDVGRPGTNEEIYQGSKEKQLND